jgi:hypothetical protein
MVEEAHTFEHFPDNKPCPICGTTDDAPCVLVPMAWTQEGRNVEAVPTHASCILNNIYMPTEGQPFMVVRLEDQGDG